MKAQFDKLDINKLVNVPIKLNNIKTKVYDLDAGKLKIVPLGLKKLSGVVDNEVIKITKFNSLRVNNLENKISDATVLIHINQYSTDKQNEEKKIGDADKKIPETSGLVTVLNWTVLNTKISEVEKNNSDNSKYIATQEYNKLMVENFAARLKQADLMNNIDFDNKLRNFNGQITSYETNI